MMKPTRQTSKSSSLKLLIITSLCIAICVIVGISGILASNLLLTLQKTGLISSEEKIDQSFSYQTILNSTSHQSSRAITEYMRSLYDENIGQKRKKRHLNSLSSSLSLSDNIDSIISLPNQYNHSHYYFQYNSSLENLTRIDLIIPIKHLTNFSTIHFKSNQFNLLFAQPLKVQKNFLKINLTQYIKSFPVTFSIIFNEIYLKSPAFLTLYFQRSVSSHSINRRDLTTFYEDNQLITYPNNPSYCQVRPLRTSLVELNWTSWIVEPSSYEMNFCSGICQTNSQMPSYLIMQNLLHRIAPKRMPTLCCKPKRFSPTILLYYDGPNLVLKRHDNMRVIECGCS